MVASIAHGQTKTGLEKYPKCELSNQLESVASISLGFEPNDSLVTVNIF